MINYLHNHTVEKLYQHFRRSPRYTLIAVFCALLHNGIMIGFDRIGFHYVVCQTISEIVLLPTGYLLQGNLTFDSGRSWYGFMRYSAALVTNYPVAIILLWLLCDVLLIDMVWASPISMVFLFAWNYMTSAWAFSGQELSQKVEPHD